MRPQARGTLVVGRKKAAPRLRQTEQPKGVSGRRGVEDDVVVGPSSPARGRELIKGGDLGRAGARNCSRTVFSSSALALPRIGAIILADRLRRLRSGRYSAPAGLGTRHRDRQIAQGHVQYLVQVRCRVGADEQHRLPASASAGRQRRRQRSFPRRPCPWKNK